MKCNIELRKTVKNTRDKINFIYRFLRMHWCCPWVCTVLHVTVLQCSTTMRFDPMRCTVICMIKQAHMWFDHRLTVVAWSNDPSLFFVIINDDEYFTRIFERWSKLLLFLLPCFFFYFVPFLIHFLDIFIIMIVYLTNPSPPYQIKINVINCLHVQKKRISNVQQPAT